MRTSWGIFRRFGFLLINGLFLQAIAQADPMTWKDLTPLNDSSDPIFEFVFLKNTSAVLFFPPFDPNHPHYFPDRSRLKYRDLDTGVTRELNCPLAKKLGSNPSWTEVGKDELMTVVDGSSELSKYIFWDLKTGECEEVSFRRDISLPPGGGVIYSPVVVPNGFLYFEKMRRQVWTGVKDVLILDKLRYSFFDRRTKTTRVIYETPSGKELRDSEQISLGFEKINGGDYFVFSVPGRDENTIYAADTVSGVLKEFGKCATGHCNSSISFSEAAQQLVMEGWKSGGSSGVFIDAMTFQGTVKKLGYRQFGEFAVSKDLSTICRGEDFVDLKTGTIKGRNPNKACYFSDSSADFSLTLSLGPYRDGTSSRRQEIHLNNSQGNSYHVGTYILGFGHKGHPFTRFVSNLDRGKVWTFSLDLTSDVGELVEMNSDGISKTLAVLDHAGIEGPGDLLEIAPIFKDEQGKALYLFKDSVLWQLKLQE